MCVRSEEGQRRNLALFRFGNLNFLQAKESTPYNPGLTPLSETRGYCALRTSLCG